eukprot:1593927-Prymnesium_polylepis.1
MSSRLPARSPPDGGEEGSEGTQLQSSPNGPRARASLSAADAAHTREVQVELACARILLDAPSVDVPRARSSCGKCTRNAQMG